MSHKTLLLILFFSSKLFSQINTNFIISSNSGSLCNSNSVVLRTSSCQGTVRWNNNIIGDSLLVTQSGEYFANCLESNRTLISNTLRVSSTSSGDFSLIGGDNCSNSKLSLSISSFPENTYPEFYRNGRLIQNENNSIIQVDSGGIYHFLSKRKNIGNWTLQIQSNSSSINDIFFLDNNLGWAVDSLGYLLTTINGGTNWSKRFIAGNELNSIFFIDSNNGWIVGKRGTLMKTTNGGLNWTYIYPISNSLNINFIDIVFTNSNTGFFVTSNGKCYKTSNAGLN